MQYRLTGDTLARQMADELVLVNVATNKIFVANETGARIWRAIEEGADLDQTISAVIGSAPDSGAAQREVDEFIGGLEREGFVSRS